MVDQIKNTAQRQISNNLHDLAKQSELDKHENFIETESKEELNPRQEIQKEKLESDISDLNELHISNKKKKDSTEEVKESKLSLGKLGNAIRKQYPLWFNVATVGLHSLGAILPNIQTVPKGFSNAIKKTAVNFSRFGVPLAKVHNGIEALYGNRLVEAFTRIVPFTLLFNLPFFNFQLPYGISSGINVALEHAYDRIGELRKEDGMKVNLQRVANGFKLMLKELTSGASSSKEFAKLVSTLGGSALMLAGSIPALIFARNSLNNTPAKIFGSIRSIGGLLGDLSITLFSTKKNPEEKRKEQYVGLFYMVPTIMDFAQRWIKQGSEANEIFNHIKVSLNTIAEMLWTHFSTERNTRQEKAQA